MIVERERRTRNFGVFASGFFERFSEAVAALVVIHRSQSSGYNRELTFGQKGRERFAPFIAALLIIGADEANSLRFGRVVIESNYFNSFLDRRFNHSDHRIAIHRGYSKAIDAAA